jgi:alpha-galactosidase
MLTGRLNAGCVVLLLALAGILGAAESHGQVKVFILAGQSNMEGHGQLRSLDWLGEHPRYGHLLGEIKNEDGTWVVRDDVTITWDIEQKETGPLTVGWGYESHEIGPELMFGTITGDAYDEPVLLIKTAWGGKDIYCDFRSPSAGEFTDREAARIEKERTEENNNREVGFYYRLMVSEIKEALANIEAIVPNYDGQGYELAGMAWFQGFNDFVRWHDAPGVIDAYPHNLAAMIRDLRKDLDVPNLPIAIGELGVGGITIAEKAKNEDRGEASGIMSFRRAQRAVLDEPDLDNVIFVPTANFWDDRLQELREKSNAYWEEKREKGIQDTEANHLPTKEENDDYLRRGGHWYAHYNGSASNYSLVGYALAKALIERGGADNDASADLALTPPMGWNSWNAFEKGIDEEKIKAIADAMVSSGMRDAGYTYLVLDDAWMAEDRDEWGRLVADPVKFPSGMKAIGDYIHSRGLKYGIYQDRGVMTCQQLPGSFEHERIDMETFAEWGVDYIKMDSCFAESNGRMSEDDYGMYREYLDGTGRPIVLSISDFGNAAWAWGGKDSSQLWRTSHDIYPWMDSIYFCAETSAGDSAIHPAFNGLGQFAGPGHWNDPDMLHVGNLKDMEDDEQAASANRAHFGLWSILAAPLMAGNDLRAMNDDTTAVLTAPEVIAVNQDARGIQGYKVFSEDGHEVYNKPLSDGTTAVLILNKSGDEADITVRWDQIGLSGSQPVRDLWAREDIGEFTDSFTASGLDQHENVLIKIGKTGPPLPSPTPVPFEKFNVTHDGETYLSDLYYIWKVGDNGPLSDTSYGGGAIAVDGEEYAKGLGCTDGVTFIYMVNGRADRFRAVVGLDDSYEGDGDGRFTVYNGDFFSNNVLWESGKMTKSTAAKEIDIDLEGVKCLMLKYDGDLVPGNWANARVIAGG